MDSNKSPLNYILYGIKDGKYRKHNQSTNHIMENTNFVIIFDK